MNDIITFIIIGVTFSILYISIKMYKARANLSYFKSKEGKKIRFGIIAALTGLPLIAFLIFLWPNNANAMSDMFKGTWFNEAGVLLGIDYTKDQSPQCERNDVDNHGTSDLQVFLNVWQNTSKTVIVDWKVWGHHSCVIGPDSQNYDATGINVKIIPWRRKQ